MKSSTVPPSSAITDLERAQPQIETDIEAIADDFSVNCRRGRVVGSQSTSGHRRQGIDTEKLISIDNGALRIRPHVTPGWARAGIAYGPFQRQAGLALAIFMLNGHNTSEGNSREDSYKSRIWRWVRGTQANSIPNRLWRRAISSQHHGTAYQFYRWARNRRNRFPKDGHIMENLALGWFPEAVPSDPTETGHSIVMRALGPNNGGLCTRCGGKAPVGKSMLTPVVEGLQNVQIYYFVVLREQGAAYYAASVPNAKGLVAFPNMRLIGIDASATEPAETLYAGLYQSALGQVGFRADTRVYDVQAQVLPALSNWYGTAQTADALIAEDPMALESALEEALEGRVLKEGATAEIGGHWQNIKGALEKTAQGLVARTNNSSALIEMPAPAGAIHVIVNATENSADSATENTTDSRSSSCGLLWRVQDERNSWGLFFEGGFEGDAEGGQCQLKLQTNGEWTQIATDKNYRLNNGRNTIQILDEGQSFSLYLNGQLLFDNWFTDNRLQDASKMGLFYQKATQKATEFAFAQLEAHPREIPIPSELLLSPPWQTAGSKTLIADSFSGAAQALSGRVVEVGNAQWQRTLGTGQINLTGEGSLKVAASVEKPNPGRVAYTVDWENPDFADVAVDILPPGTARDQNERGRGGLIFWQDKDNYITINHWLDDGYGGAAISAFFHIDGFEEVFDAVWTNVGNRVVWGQKQQFRVAFDGTHFTVYVGEEPVLYRALTDIYPQLQPLAIRRVGIVVNWEWGDDTGTEFSRFVAKA